MTSQPLTAQEVGRALAVAEGEPPVVEETFGGICVDVPPERWLATLDGVRDLLGCTYFDWLSAVDELDGYAVVAHLWNVEQGAGVLVRTRIPREPARLASATGLFAGASWHERETYEMFGVEFEGHPNLVPLLLPDGFEGHPLRKEFVLASRAAKPWPGAKEPGESDGDLGGPGRPGHAAPGRRRVLPPGVPDPATWGPRDVDRTDA